jgi:hypothetical protein
MKRREFIAATAALLVSPRRSWAQERPRRVLQDLVGRSLLLQKAASLNYTCKARIFFHGSGLPAVRVSWPRSPVSRWSYRGAAATLVTSPADCLRRFRPPRQSKHGNQRYLLCDEVRARVGDNERE